MHKAPLILIASSAAALGLTGCSNGEAPLYNPGNSAVTVPTEALPAASGGALTKASANTITATETEFHIGLSKSRVKAGTYTIVARNRGTIVHGLEVDGPGVDDRGVSTVAPGASRRFTVRLKRGRYTLYCPVEGHRAEGMVTRLTVS